MKGEDKNSWKAQASSSNVDAPTKKHFYSLRSKGEQESALDVVNRMVQVFFINVYALLGPGSTLSIFIPFASKKFDIL